ncbi:MauE/DoxX family redox-associated membrane protein [Sorangium sp. So ce131]|uniref:MauE/DoxX family redox-associated membrane protein n=1 Tax=Sorangium sp. So ce131 TaxID=3133282 RepID=UPI003F644980
MKTALLWLLRLGLGGMFLAAGALKFLDPASFAIEIHNYQLFPQLAPLLAATLPTVEVAVGLALIAGPRPWLRAGALASTLLLLVFTVAVITVVARGVDVTCGCFGEDSGPVTVLTVLRDVVLVAAGVLLFRLAGEPPAGPQAERARPHPG